MNSKNRSSIIKTTDNESISYLKRIFNKLPLSDNNEIVYDYLYHQTPLYNETDKFGIFYSLKSGSRLIQTTLQIQNRSLFTNNNFRQDLRTPRYDELRHLLSINKSDSYQYKILNELKLILDGNSQKDLIILIRNPLKKFISGLIIDIQNDFAGSKIIRKKYNFINHDSIYSFSDEILYEIINMYISRYTSEDSIIDFGHSALYNETYYHILSNFNLDLSKVKIVDLDNVNSNISELLCMYYPELISDETINSFWTQRKFHAKFINVLNQVMAHKSNIGIFERIQREIYSDYFYYALIYKKFNKNIFVNSDVK